MVRNGEIGLAEAKRTLRRYWWILPLSTLFLGGLGLVATFVLPKRYTSQTMVLVEQPTVGPDYVKPVVTEDRKSTRLNSSHGSISYAVFCLKKKKTQPNDL